MNTSCGEFLSGSPLANQQDRAIDLGDPREPFLEFQKSLGDPDRLMPSRLIGGIES